MISVRGCMIIVNYSCHSWKSSRPMSLWFCVESVECTPIASWWIPFQSIYQSINLSIYLSIYLFIDLSIYLSIYLMHIYICVCICIIYKYINTTYIHMPMKGSLAETPQLWRPDSSQPCDRSCSANVAIASKLLEDACGTNVTRCFFVRWRIYRVYVIMT